MTRREIEDTATRLGSCTRFSFGQIERFLLAFPGRDRDQLEDLIVMASREGMSLEVLQMSLSS